MNLTVKEVRQIIADKGLKATTQRIVILTVVYGLENHPRAENIIAEVQKKYPRIAVGTIYRILETFVNTGIIRKVKSDNGVVRYDGKMKGHHHLYCDESDLIEDYEDEKLDDLLGAYFKDRKIGDYKIENISLQIKVVKDDENKFAIGKYINTNS